MSVKDEVKADPSRAGPLALELAKDTTTGGLLLSNDGKSFVLIAEFTYDETRSIETGAVVQRDALLVRDDQVLLRDAQAVADHLGDRVLLRGQAVTVFRGTLEV